MNFEIYSHRYADVIINNDDYLFSRYQEFIDVLYSISDDDLIDDFIIQKAEHSTYKSISHSINYLIRERLTQIPGWYDEVEIFNDPLYTYHNTDWRLDFACENGFAVEIAFNHGEAIAWNLTKPCLASELNHVEKAIQTKVGIYVCATDKMKKAGNFDGAIGSYEKVIRYLKPMMNQLTTPILIIGLNPPETFRISHATKEVIKFSE